MPTSPKNPHGAVKHALKTRNFKAAARYVTNNPWVLTADEPHRVALTLAATGATGEEASLKLQAWAWLDAQGFEFPVTGAGYAEVMGTLLEKEPMELVEAWHGRAGSPVITPDHDLLVRALHRRTAEALKWWVNQGLPLTEPAADTHRLPHVLMALAHHRLNTPDHVLFLLSQGVQPLRRIAPDEPQVAQESPLIVLTRQYRDLENVGGLPRNGMETFRALWVALVEAGDDPTYQSALKERPVDLLSQTTSAGWWDAWQRHRQAPAHPGETHPVARRRLRS